MDEAALFLEPRITFPELPVVESEIVVVGTIGTAQAFLSENKRNVFSEFTLTVEDVLKSKIQGVAQGSVLTIDRVGGHVKYPNGQRVLFRIAGLNMPRIGGRYLLFLTSTHGKVDISILTAYEFTPEGAIPLDQVQGWARGYVPIATRSHFGRAAGNPGRQDRHGVYGLESQGRSEQGRLPDDQEAARH